jgi:hypothetical protein
MRIITLRLSIECGRRKSLSIISSFHDESEIFSLQVKEGRSIREYWEYPTRKLVVLEICGDSYWKKLSNV